jgi:hypothetical protein
VTWYAWAILGLVALNVVGNIASIGRPREPISLQLAGLVLIVNSLTAWGPVAERLCAAGGRHSALPPAPPARRELSSPSAIAPASGIRTNP